MATTTSKAELALEPHRCWHGPFWIILNWLVATGLRWYGYEELSNAIDRG